MADSTEKVKVIIEGDSRSVVDALTKFKGASEAASKSSASFTSSLTSINSAFELAKKGAEGLGKAYGFLKEHGNTVAFERSIRGISEATEGLASSIAQSVTQSSALGVALDGVAKDIQGATGDARGLGVALGDGLAKSIVVAEAAMLGFQRTTSILRRGLAGAEELVYGVGTGFARLAGREDLADAWAGTMREAGDRGFAEFESSAADIEARAEALRARWEEISRLSGRSLGSRRVAGGKSDASKDAEREATERAKLAADAAAEEARTYADAKRAAISATGSKVDLLRFERDERIKQLELQFGDQRQFESMRVNVTAQYATQMRQVWLDEQAKERADEAQHLTERNKQVQAWISTRTRAIMDSSRSEIEAHDEAMRSIAQGINNFSAIASAAFQAGHVWAEAFKAGAKPRDIARGIFSTLSLGLGVAGMIAGGPTNPLGAGLLAGGVLTGGVGGFFHGGGMVGPTSVPVRAHGGLSPPLVGERDIRARVGEGVLSSVGVQAIGGPRGVEQANRGESPSSAFHFAPVINVSPGIGASDVKMILDREMTTYQSGFMRELRRTGAVRQGAR